MEGVDGTMSMADGSSMSGSGTSGMPNAERMTATSAASAHRDARDARDAGAPVRNGSVPHDNHSNGQCCTYCGSAPVGVDVGRLPTLLVLPVRIVEQLAVWMTGVVRPASVDVVLPYPNGPPSSRRV
jgi:hypothetical protein